MIEDMACVFCAIAAGEIPATVVHETDDVVAFRDLAADPATMVAVLQAVDVVAASEGLDEGFRVVFNTGGQGGQEVDHVHAHVIGVRQMQWPPG